MTRRRASCCCDPGLPCDAFNLACFGSVIPPKYVRIDGARSENHRDNVLAQDAQGQRCECPGAPFYTYTATEIIHLEGPRRFVNDGIYLGYQYDLVGTSQLDWTETYFCPDCTVPQPPRVCSTAALRQRTVYRERANIVGALRCTPCNYGNGLYGTTYGIFATKTANWSENQIRYVCCDPNAPTERFAYRGTQSNPLSLVFDPNPATVCNFNGLCNAGDRDYVTRTVQPTQCSRFDYLAVDSIRYQFTGSIKAVFSTV